MKYIDDYTMIIAIECHPRGAYDLYRSKETFQTIEQW